MTTYRSPTISPLNATIPAATALATPPGSTSYSMPRLPGHHTHAGSRYGSATVPATGTGQHGPAPSTGDASPSTADTITVTSADDRLTDVHPHGPARMFHLQGQLSPAASGDDTEV